MSEEVVVTADTIEPPQKKVGIVKVAGVLGILGGIALIVVGIVVWVMVSTQLRAEIVSFGVAAFAIGIGILSILFGWALNRLASVPVIVRRSTVTRA